MGAAPTVSNVKGWRVCCFSSPAFYQIHFLLLKISRINSLFTFLSRQEIQTKEINAPILNPSKKYPVKITNQRRSKNVMSIHKIYQNSFISQIQFIVF